MFSGPKLEPVLPKKKKKNGPNPDIRDLCSGHDNSLISRLHCMTRPRIEPRSPRPLGNTLPTRSVVIADGIKV